MLPPDMQSEMDEFRREEKESKAAVKAEKARAKGDKSLQTTAKAKQGQRGAVVRKHGRDTRC